MEKCLKCKNELEDFAFLNFEPTPEQDKDHYWHRHGYCFFGELLTDNGINVRNSRNFTVANRLSLVGICFATKGITEDISMAKHGFRALKMCVPCFSKLVKGDSKKIAMRLELNIH